jgi:hypothetical protein
MNERIRELAVQAGSRLGWDYDPDKSGHPDSGYFLEFFAELIVKECIDVCANGWQGEFTAAGISQCVSDLKEHFGVK